MSGARKLSDLARAIARLAVARSAARSEIVWLDYDLLVYAELMRRAETFTCGTGTPLAYHEFCGDEWRVHMREQEQ